MNPVGRGTESFGALLRAYRTASGLTQRELAVEVGISVAAIRDLEQGRRTRPRRASVDRLTGALGLDRGQAEEFARAALGERLSARPVDRVRILRLSILGPLLATRGTTGTSICLGPPRQRALLGFLALNANTLVHRDRIIEALWMGEPPGTAIDLLQVSVSRLRRALDPDGSRQTRGRRLASAGASYRLEAAPNELDLLAFRELTRRAAVTRAAGEAASACDLYERALILWRGDPLADVDVLRDNGAVAATAAQRVATVLSYATLAAEQGWHDRVLPWLRASAQHEPMNERVHASLMITLAALGEQAAALRIYTALRQHLDQQLGVQPGRELTDAYLRVLRQDIPVAAPRRTPDRAVSPTKPGPPALLPPRQLPAVAVPFVGRAPELAALTRLLRRVQDRTPGGAVVAVIAGTAGVGKTALAVHWAHRVAGEFPDGQLFTDLHGYGPGQPVAATDALVQLLHALGLADQDIPAEAEERGARYRSLLAGQRMLIVLDNAHSVAQVRPLLPAAPGCVTVVTSRSSLADLVARDGAVRLDLDVLPSADAVVLLRELIGDRVDVAPDAAAELGGLCSRLPLTLRVAAELAMARPAASLGDLTRELADEQGLSLLDAGEDPVRAVFSWSYRYLDAETARAFRMLGLHPGLDLDRYAAAALIGSGAGQAEQTASVMAQAHLIHRVGPRRYAMHRVIRAYARDLADALDTEAERKAALTRLFDYYLNVAVRAMDMAFAPERAFRLTAPAAASPAPPMPDPASARAWLDAELPNVAGVVAYAAAHGWLDHSSKLAAVVSPYLDTGGRCGEAITIHGHARRARPQYGR